MMLNSNTSVGEFAQEQADAQAFAKQILQSRIFLGSYEERRYVDALRQYRDVVVVNAAERILIKDLQTVSNRLNLYAQLYIWIGITPPGYNGAPEGVCLWVKLSNVPFGQYWFQIRHISFSGQGEVLLKLKCIRQIDQNDIQKMIHPVVSEESVVSRSTSENSVNSESSQERKRIEPKVSEYQFDFDPADFVKKMHSSFTHDIIPGLSRAMTFDNILYLIKFTSAAFVTLVFGIITLIGFIGEYSLRLLRELTFFLQTITPLLIHVIDAITKCVGGLYILLAMLWRGQNFPQPQPKRNVQQLMYHQMNHNPQRQRFNNQNKSPRSSFTAM